jgi:hypothetical protein
MPDTTKVREHHSAMELTERIKSALATLGWPFRYELQSIPQFAAEMEKAGFSARFVQHIDSVAQDYQGGIFAVHERRHRNDHREAAANSRRIRVAKPREVHRLMVQRKEDLPWVGSRTRPLS